MITQDDEQLRDELRKANRTIKELRGEIDLLSEEVEEKDRQIAKYKDVKGVLKMLLEAEEKAEELERITNSDLAVDLWHNLRETAAAVQEWVHPSLHVTISDSDAGIITKYTINNL